MKARASKSKVPTIKRNCIQSLTDEKSRQKSQNAGEIQNKQTNMEIARSLSM